MRPFRVVVFDVLAQRPSQTAFTEQHHPPQALALDRPHEALRISVRVRRAVGGRDELKPLALERALPRPRELRVAVAEQHAVAAEEAVFLVSQLPRDLRHPRAVRIRRRAGDLHDARLQVDHEERVECDQAARRPDLAGEEVRRRDLAPVALQEGAPRRGPLRRRLQPLVLQDARDRRATDAVAELQHLALDARIAPGRVLRRQAHDEPPDLPPHPAPPLRRLLVRPLLRDQRPVPAQHRVRGDERRELPQHPPPEHLPLRREPPSLPVRQSQLALPELFLEDAVLLEEVLDRPVLLAMHPGRDGE